MLRRLTLIFTLMAMVGLIAAPAVSAAPARAGALQGIPVTGALQGGGTFDGTIDITSITRDGNILNVTGAIDGLLNGVTPVTDTFTSTLDLSALTGNQGNGQGQGSCQILFLELGPLFLDLLGLVVEIPDPIVLDVRAEPGPGNLLGNLLCAVAGLLDGGGPLAALDNLLRQVNRLLG
jgi:hypothetical protein